MKLFIVYFILIASFLNVCRSNNEGTDEEAFYVDPDAVELIIDNCQKELFNADVESPFNENGTINNDFLDKRSVNLNMRFWSPAYIDDGGNICNIEYWQSPVNKGDYWCYMGGITHNYFKNELVENMTDDNLKEFRESYHVFFELEWRPEFDNTHISFNCIHSRFSHNEVLLQITIVDDDIIIKEPLVSVIVEKNNKGQIVELYADLKKYQKYLLKVLIRAEKSYYDNFENRVEPSDEGFIIRQIHQICESIESNKKVKSNNTNT